MINPSGNCKTTEPYLPGVCQIENVASIAECEAYCTNQQSCVGYSYQHRTSLPGYCELFPTESTCPTSLTSPEHELSSWLEDLVSSVDDLIPKTDPGFECYGKTSGRNI